MNQHDGLMERKEQHKPKNTQSKNDDKHIAVASRRVIEYISERFKDVIAENGLTFEHQNGITLKEISEFIKRRSNRTEFDTTYFDREIRPDGGVIYLVTKDGTKLPLVISEAKHQGTNKERMGMGKTKQAVGNAIERLGKNLTGIRAMMHYEDIVPFVCFGWGCDFGTDDSAKIVLAKVSTMNQLYPLNKTYIFKRDSVYGSKISGFAPVSMYFREEEWTSDEMYEIMKEIAETSFRYYMS